MRSIWLTMAAAVVGAVITALITYTFYRPRIVIEPVDPAMKECLKDLEEMRRELELARTSGCPSLPECWLPCTPDGG